MEIDHDNTNENQQVEFTESNVDAVPSPSNNFETSETTCPTEGVKKRRKGNYVNRKKYVSKNRLPCQLCSATVCGEQNMDKHMQNHDKYEVISCDKCSFKTLWRSSLSDHTFTQCNTVPFKCELCPYNTIRLRGLQSHYDTMHDGKSKHRYLSQLKVSLVFSCG